MKVETGASLGGFASDASTGRSVVEPAAGVRLVRRLVLREASVAIDPEHRPLGIAADLRCEACQPSVELGDQLVHRLAHLLLVFGTPCLEPLLVVVRGKLPEEAKGCRRERHTCLSNSEVRSWPAANHAETMAVSTSRLSAPSSSAKCLSRFGGRTPPRIAVTLYNE